MQIKAEEAELPPERRVGDGSISLRGKPSDKSKSGTWRAASFLYVIVFVNSLVLLALQGNLITYTVNILHLDVATAANLTNYIAGSTMVATIIFGFIADAYILPFWVIAASCVVYGGGLIGLVLAVSLPNLIPPQCDEAVCPPASQHIQSVFMAGLFITGLGAAGIKPTVLSLGRQQFDYTDPVEKEKGILFFSYYYAVFEASLLLATTVFFWLQTDVGFKEGYSTMAGTFYAGIIISLFGIRYLRHQKPVGSPLTILAKVIVAATRNWRKPLPADGSNLYELEGETSDIQLNRIRKITHSEGLKFLDKAAVLPDDAKRLSSDQKQQLMREWKLCTVTQVEVLKVVLLLFPNWLCSCFLYVAAAQNMTFGVQQVSGMDRHWGSFTFPPATVMTVSIVSSLLWIAVYEYVLLRPLKKWTGHPRGLSPQVRTGLGLFFAAATMGASALVEMRRVSVIRAHNITDLQVKRGLIPMSAAWVLPELILMGFSHPLLGTAMLELYHQEFPENMVSLSMALTFGCQALGRFIAIGIVNATERFSGDGGAKSWLKSGFNTGGLANYYWLLTVIMFVNLCVFVLYAHFYTYKNLREDDQTESTVKANSDEASEYQVKIRSDSADDSNIDDGSKKLVRRSVQV
ncbi:hypothetical protein AXG93_2551s1030 [Marchantia polymorpha subsp. ruderalis]|uniref:Uncharacterized protein n=1 Tax=Marchantia polymorpha subsp. ruderalis TaxID=1480154 RepID=A0A176VDX1_MARPO|nr:hypothetical protein AXG93_2551s1030 [Marchantia polymorpha subsp. ruderalis]